jgi:RNA polymerase sigma factor (TIGR02999 family)
MVAAMMPTPSADVTTLLRAWRGGDAQALERLTPLVYDHLRRLGRQYVRRERADLQGDATSLVHQAFMRLVDARTVDWQDRVHFLAVCSQIMRRILVDAARARATAKRGAGMERVDPLGTTGLDGLPARTTERAREVCALDDALQAMARREPRRAQVIELRFFGGLSVEETADVLQVSPQTVMRDWKLARAWLAMELNREPSRTPPR